MLSSLMTPKAFGLKVRLLLECQEANGIQKVSIATIMMWAIRDFHEPLRLC